jgi:3D (Asp-Asp-Asp) domain-containing protein
VAGLRIVIDRSRPMTISIDGSVIETRVNGATVGEALAEVGVVLSGLDYAIPAESTEILPGLSVRVIRVTEEFSTEEETVPYDVVYQADNTLELDRRAVLQAGQSGLFQRTFRVRYENGIEVSREIEQETTVRYPQNHIVGYGTQVVIRSIDTPEGTLQYWRKLSMYATSYYPAEFGDGDAYTSIGEVLTKGIIAIDPHIIQYRTNLYVPGYGTGVAADTGGPRSTPYWIDLGYDNDNFIGWSGWSDVYVLLPVPGTINYLLPENERGGPIP